MSLQGHESVVSLYDNSQDIDYADVIEISIESVGAVKIFQFHRKTNILHSVFTLKARIQEDANKLAYYSLIAVSQALFSVGLVSC